MKVATLMMLVACCLACGGSSLTTYRVADDLTVHQIKLSVSNVYVVEGESGVVLVDAGDPGQEGDILKGLEEAGVDPADVRAILITHAHADHTGSAKALAEELDVPIVIQTRDAEQAATGRNPKLPAQNVTAVFLKWFLKKRFDAYEADEPFERCAELEPWGVAGLMRSAPGHTDGSSIIELAHGVVIVGDLLAGGFFGGSLSPKNPESHYFHEDPEQVRTVLRWLVDSKAKQVFVGHGGPLEAKRIESELDRGEFGKRGRVRPWAPTRCDRAPSNL